VVRGDTAVVLRAKLNFCISVILKQSRYEVLNALISHSSHSEQELLLLPSEVWDFYLLYGFIDMQNRSGNPSTNMHYILNNRVYFLVGKIIIRY